MVDDLAVADVHPGDGRHLLWREGKIPDRPVFVHPLRADGFGDGHHAALVVPAQDDLRGGPAVPARDLPEHLVVEDIPLRFGERAPRLGLHTVFLHDGQRLLLLEKRVDLDLVDHGTDLVVHAQIDQPLRGKVAHPDGAHRSLAVQPFHGAPCSVIIAEGLVDQI